MQDVVAKVGLNNACILMTSVILLFIIYSESTFSFLCSVAGLNLYIGYVLYICICTYYRSHLPVAALSMLIDMYQELFPF